MEIAELDIAEMECYSEAQWKAKYRDCEGDGSIIPAFIMVIWDDPNETPSEAIGRLNDEVNILADKINLLSGNKSQ